MNVFVYPYSPSVAGNPPTPVVWLNVAAVGSDQWRTNLAALVDTGADVTVLPASVVTALGLEELDEVATVSFDAGLVRRKTHAVRLVIRDLPAIEVEVVGGGEMTHAILGRDVLNRYRVVFDGPNLKLEISG